MIELRFLHSALPLMVVHQCIKFHLIPFYTYCKVSLEFENILNIRQNFLSIGPVWDRFFWAFGCFQSVPISEFWSGTERNSIFSSKLFTAKIKKGSNSVNTGDRVMVLALCNSPHGPLSLYQVSFIYIQ